MRKDQTTMKSVAAPKKALAKLSFMKSRSMTTPSMTSPSMKGQQGLTMISWIVVIVFLLFQAVIAMNILPVYITDSSVKNIIEALPSDMKARGLPPRALKTLVAKRLSMDSVYDVTADDITVKKGRGVNTVKIEYEPRGKLIGNLEYIVSFKHEAQVSSQ